MEKKEVTEPREPMVKDEPRQSAQPPQAGASVSANPSIGRTLVFTVSHLINDTYPNLYPVLLPALMATLNFNTAAAGLISTVSALSAQLLQPLMGFWADRSGGRKFVVGGLALGSVLAAFAFGWAPSYSILLILLLISGLGNAAFHPHAAALVSEMTGKRKGLGMSLFMIGGNFGRGLAPLLAGTAFLWGGRPGLFFLAIPGLLMALIMAGVMSPPPPPKPRTGKIFTPEFLQGLRRAGSLLTVVALRNMTSLATLTLVPILWHSLGYPLTDTAGLLSLMFIAGSFGNVAGGTLSDIIGPKPVLISSALLSSFWLFLFLHVHNFLLSFVLIALLGISLYSTSSVVMVFGQALFPANKGMASGLTLGIGNTLGTFGVAVIGLIADRYSITAGLYVSAAAVLISIPFVLRLKDAKPAGIQ
ncbi:Major facilitator superfamily transporter [Acididesulfobacillus acetoxydans]|uniref:Major facilitator superfamily transporter n=1 Tax=Acididesulfobacillus acetoxydans TaxID=1561005 RepID=A0A8S0W1P3_9FIRM|nr:MFS transporter [Acididesulfobacillus acetoxydans]CAA7599658.1 Major facilitator superfamily transporter [Acididesulfobacillus acetoxydans]CEJ06210.1 Major facilitator transporter [Acididesulfobacillus acetoxydans]